MRLSEAKKAQDILDVLARRAWHEAHDGAECPSDQVPTSADMVAWRPDDVSVRTALEQLVNLLDSQPFDKADLTPPLLLSHAMLNGGYGRFCKTFELPDPGAVFSYLLERTHQSWINLLGLWPDLRHPLAAMVQAWQGRIKAADPFNPVKRASLPRLQGMGEGELRLSGFPPSHGASRQLELFAPAITSAFRLCHQVKGRPSFPPLNRGCIRADGVTGAVTGTGCRLRWTSYVSACPTCRYQGLARSRCSCQASYQGRQLIP